MTDSEITNFQETVWNFFHDNHRDMPWRQEPTPYYVLVSELMLQQTQVSRVIPKFETFITRFPTFAALSGATLGDVLICWSGLGYNRRAKFLWDTARMVVEEYDGELPQSHDELVTLPGIGPNTAGAICAYAFNQPVVFVETNIRTVFLHHFYADSTDKVTDKELLRLVRETLDLTAPREWYWALMDYGTHLKKTAGGRLDQSHHYRKQAPLAGSRREMRGRIIRVLTHGKLDDSELRREVTADDRYEPALVALQSEGMVMTRNGYYCLTALSDDR